jgi:hypothetical protein
MCYTHLISKNKIWFKIIVLPPTPNCTQIYSLILGNKHIYRHLLLITHWSSFYGCCVMYTIYSPQIRSLQFYIIHWYSLSLFPAAPTLEHKASVKHFVSPQFLNPKIKPIARPLPIQTENKRRQTSMPSVGFKPTMPVFKWAKTVHALDRVANVIGTHWYSCSFILDANFIAG